MSLTPGTQLGPYEISEPLGQGGMGEVYRARDTRLGREVAIKVLPDDLREDDALRERLELEARAISQLQHPNICTLYDLGHQDGVDFLVMELLEGETLQERLRRGALPVAEALEVGARIAGALDRAHRSGIVHRDLKPGNVMLTPDGPKVLDFGLAKDVPKAAVSIDTNSPTALLTQAGTILGTLQYMAPEQLEGKDVDARADVFAFGCLLYEMLTGERAFQGESQASLIASLLERPAPSLEGVAGLSPLHATVVERCLVKRPDGRWQSLADVKILLEAAPLGSAPRGPEPDPANGRRPAARWRAVAGLAALAALVLGVALGRWSAPEAPPPEARVRHVVLVQSTPGGIEQLTNPALSHDGRSVVFAGGTSEGSALFVRRLDELEPHPIPDTAAAGWARFSPDDRWVVYFDALERRLVRIPVLGGIPEVLADPGYIPFDLQPDGSLYYLAARSSRPPSSAGRGDSTESAIVRQSPDGTVDVLARPEPGEGSSPQGLAAPAVLPGGRRLLLSRGEGFLQSGWETGVLDLDTGDWKTVLRGVNQASYADGFLVYWREDQLWAGPFDLDTLALREPPRAVLGAVAQHPGAPVEVGQYHLAADGSLVYVRGESKQGEVNRLYFARSGMDPASAPTEVLSLEGRALDLRLSPDRRQVALARCPRRGLEGGRDVRILCGIWVGDVADPQWKRISPAAIDARLPAWDPDGRSLVYVDITDEERLRVVRQALDDATVRPLLEVAPGELPIPVGVDPERRLLLSVLSADRASARVVRVDPDGESRSLLADPSDLTATDLSADGRWLLLEPVGLQASGVYLLSLEEPGAEPALLLSDGGRWSSFGPDGREVYYRSASFPGAAEILRADLDPERARLGPAEVVAPTRSVNVSSWRYFSGLDVSSEGVYFLVPQAAGSTGELVLVENWTKSLRDVFRDE